MAWALFTAIESLMRKASFQPAVQLGSACQRYCPGRLTADDYRPWRQSGANSPADQLTNQAGSDTADPLSRLEAVLFLSREPLNSRKLAQFAGLEDGTRAR